MIIPILHRIVLKLDNVEEVSDGGIIIPKQVVDKERKAVEIATVVAIGPTAFQDYGGGNDTIKVGDHVVIARYSGKDVVDTDETGYIVCNDEDIICILKGED